MKCIFKSGNCKNDWNSDEWFQQGNIYIMIMMYFKEFM